MSQKNTKNTRTNAIGGDFNALCSASQHTDKLHCGRRQGGHYWTRGVDLNDGLRVLKLEIHWYSYATICASFRDCRTVKSGQAHRVRVGRAWFNR